MDSRGGRRRGGCRLPCSSKAALSARHSASTQPVPSPRRSRRCASWGGSACIAISAGSTFPLRVGRRIGSCRHASTPWPSSSAPSAGSPALPLATVGDAAIEAPQINTAGTYFRGATPAGGAGISLVASCFESRGPRLVPSRLLTFAVGVGIVLFAAQFAAFDRALDVYKAGKGIRAGPPGTCRRREAHCRPGRLLVGAIVTLALVVVSTAACARARARRTHRLRSPVDIQPPPPFEP